MTYSNPVIPKDAVIIAEGQGYAVLRIDIDSEPYYILKGCANTDYLFNKEEWDRFAKTVAYADIKIRGGIE